MLNVTCIPAFSDNYLWLLTSADQPSAHQQYGVIVDPGDASPVLKKLQQMNITLCAILITHHHSDHVGGIAKLLEHYPDIPVYGPANERIPHRSHALGEGDIVELKELGMELKVLDVPGHTSGHIAYYGEGALFCGDTLFANGCGRIFGGSAKDLYQSLSRIAQLPAETLIYCAHEYTVDNIGFARWVEPDNNALAQRLEECHQLLDANKQTVPSLLSLELETNPFLRIAIPEVTRRINQHLKKELSDPAELFAALRTWKDTEYD